MTLLLSPLFCLSSVSPAAGYMYCRRRLGHKYTCEHMEGFKEVSDMLFLLTDSSIKFKVLFGRDLLFLVGNILQEIFFPQHF